MNRQAGDPPEFSGPISLRPITVQDIPFGLKLSGLAGWNQTEADWEMLLEQSTTGSFLACYDGVEAGTVTTVTYQKQLNWVGMMLVAPEFQRLGIGTALLRAAIQAVEAPGVVCLDATPAGKPLYDRFGFHDLYCLGRWLRPPASLGMQPAGHCHPLTQESLRAILAYDHPVFGADRTGILYALQHNAPSLALFAEYDHEIKGFCLGRIGQKYVQIGPVIANRLEIARDLLLSALQTCAHQPVILDNTLHHPGWNQLLHELGFVEQRPFIRMRLGEFIYPEHHARQFAIAGPEIG
jgi:GNAT superfamily N-acetyltransferase